MPTGKIKTLVHLSQQTHQPTANLAPGHNDKGYGILEDEEGRAVYFSPETVDCLHDFEDLQCGQQLEYTLERTPYLRAATVRVAADHAAAHAGHRIHWHNERNNER